MQIEWIFGLAGGVLIGLGGAVYLLVNGRIMGASGIIGGIVDGSAGSQKAERAWFLAGLFGVPTVLALLFGNLQGDGPAQTYATENLWAVVVAGLLVGVGTRIANGCTSGHGVCGISRLSLRGIVATVFYIVAGGFGVILFKHLLGWV
ncbi:YeeE/YedE family protein [Marivivens donghaensis]|uniref:YeeE/YedE family protein n=1 Tax=Marivivens donghaensis TaxID=1699413 RepID=UPI00201EAF80|nr:YeeE/YedE thiosulfate transporter family protein [Marivivens donghaensis]MCL7408197.1 YeeE/YedE family protein [Marivivens donghaensis]MDN3705032.1 YeeE/YedE thiosulfate transporter family protein [Marivivens donghaensis]